MMSLLFVTPELHLLFCIHSDFIETPLPSINCILCSYI